MNREVKNKRLTNVKLLSIAVIVSVVISIACSALILRPQQVDTVDLGKIVNAQMLIAGRMAAQGNLKEPWMTTIQETSQRLRKAIKQVAGNRLVIVTPAVVQGAHDITNQVLAKLGLPEHIPQLNIPQSKVIPQLVPKQQPAGQKQTQNKGWELP